MIYYLKKYLSSFFVILWIIFIEITFAQVTTNQRIDNIRQKRLPEISEKLKNSGLEIGSSVYICIFKQEKKLELWMNVTQQDTFELYKTFDICYFSGTAGPKIRIGDMQSPEGFYFVSASGMNPWSRFHLSFNLGFPNAYDRYYKRTGNYLMVHGDCVSIGCYAMTDPNIEEIYIIAEAALNKGQKFFRVHIYPFRMTNEILEKVKNHKWYQFWSNLKEGYDFFIQNRYPPNVRIKEGNYIFE